ncbi:MAG: sulfatase-like hydrolase/transferase, partial [Oscillospiraceae bacterium]|nr:sulfatase-like hydrolase/transferase [Oscillospiraceae bacterium]
EYALEYLVNALEEAGIAKDTVIVLTADHYPYAMSEGNVDYYNELTGQDDSERLTSRYRNTLILWSGSMEEPVTVDTPCSSIDIVPTLSNLFGLEYDSRLLSGRDILASDVEAGEVATNMNVVIFPDSGYGNSWSTAAGTYEASTGTFTPNEGVEVDDDYVSAVSQLVQERYTYARYLISEDYYRHIFPDM